MRKKKTMILVLDKDDEEKELNFEVDYMLSLTTKQRFNLIFEGSKLVEEILIRNGHRKLSNITEIIKRK